MKFGVRAEFGLQFDIAFFVRPERQGRRDNPFGHVLEKVDHAVVALFPHLIDGFGIADGDDAPYGHDLDVFENHGVPSLSDGREYLLHVVAVGQVRLRFFHGSFDGLAND